MTTAGTRFRFSIQPKDGGSHRHFYADLDAVILPQRDDLVYLDTDHGRSFAVLHVGIYPTCDPAVHVRLRTYFPDTTAEGDELVKDALLYGWKEVG